MRAIVVFFGLIATVAGAYGGFLLMREVGPGDLSSSYGSKSTTTAKGDGSTLLQTRQFALVVQAIEREVGPDARIQHLNVEPLDADATAIVGDRMIRVEVDPYGRSQQRDVGEASPGAGITPGKLDPDAIDKITKTVRKESSEPVKSLTLQGHSREWTVYMERGEPDSFLANLDGGGLRLSGEENPEPVGAGPDSMFRAKNLQRVLDAAAKEGDRVIDVSIWPERVSISLAQGGRQVRLDYAYEAQLTNRDVQARTGAQRGTVALSRIDAGAITRMARHREVKGIKNARYVLMQPAGVFGPKPMLLLYLAEGSDPPYVVADLKGRGLTWPGRG
jgi:hypothetical protein